MRNFQTLGVGLDENGRVLMTRRRGLDSIMMNLVDGADRKLGGLTETVEGRSAPRTKKVVQ